MNFMATKPPSPPSALPVTRPARDDGGSVVLERRTQKTQPVRSAIDAPAGSFYVPLNQGLANLAVAALEPDTESSYFANRLIDSLASTARVMSVPSLVFEETDQ